jgi:quinol monooxygenase YgiN
MLVIAAMLKVLDGKGDGLERDFGKLVPKVLEEPGVITYVVHRSIDNPSRFFVYEKYKSREDFDYHCTTPHFKEFFEAFESIKDGEPEIAAYKEIARDC